MRVLVEGNDQLLPTRDDACVPISGPLRLDREQVRAAIGRACPHLGRDWVVSSFNREALRGLSRRDSDVPLRTMAVGTDGALVDAARQLGASTVALAPPLPGNVSLPNGADGERGSGAAGSAPDGAVLWTDNPAAVPTAVDGRPLHTAHPAGPRFAYPAACPSLGTGGTVPVAPDAHGKEECPR